VPTDFASSPSLYEIQKKTTNTKFIPYSSKELGEILWDLQNRRYNVGIPLLHKELVRGQIFVSFLQRKKTLKYVPIVHIM
jgi:hypothetical protein